MLVLFFCKITWAYYVGSEGYFSDSFSCHANKTAVSDWSYLNTQLKYVTFIVHYHVFMTWRNRFAFYYNPDSKIHGANMRPTWVLPAPDGPHVGPMNLAIWEYTWYMCNFKHAFCLSCLLCFVAHTASLLFYFLSSWWFRWCICVPGHLTPMMSTMLMARGVTRGQWDLVCQLLKLWAISILVKLPRTCIGSSVL